MTDLFHEKAFSAVVEQLHGLGYRNELWRQDYGFKDYLANDKECLIEGAAFGQTPASYETALLGVACSNGRRETALIDEYRALGAPFILEVDSNEIREWAVSRKVGGHALVGKYPLDRIRQLFVDRAHHWKPQNLLRSKNIGSFLWIEQPSLFAGLVPELEEQIRAKLEPLLHNALVRTSAVYKETSGNDPAEEPLFKLIFSVLTAKVFFDRRVNGFASLRENEKDILTAVENRYGESRTRLLNRDARQMAVASIWRSLDFRNLSVDVLGQIWSTILIDPATKKRLGIHRTPKSIVRYIVQNIPFQQSGDDDLIIFEPCTGSSAFLIGAMNELRPNLLMPSEERHDFFRKRFVGIEKDSFGVEISKLALTLADFPYGGDWKINKDDVFRDGSLTEHLRRSAVVLCNPPFQDFEPNERRKTFRSPHKPTELLYRVLKDLHPDGVLGFVLPRNIIDGQGYKEIRRLLVDRFASIEINVLPDSAFDASTESGLLIATNPIQHNTTTLTFSQVREHDWKRFDFLHEVSYQNTAEVTAEQAVESLAIPELQELWQFLSRYDPLRSIATASRGIEWDLPLTKNGVETGNREKLVRNEPVKGFMRGIPPKGKLKAFQVPSLAYLSRREEDQRGGAWEQPWELPKAIVNKAAYSRFGWRMAAVPDSEGLIVYQNLIGIWPTSKEYDEVTLAAILNSPVANAFVATREGKTNITIEVLYDIPVPKFTATQKEQLKKLVKAYQKSAKPLTLFSQAKTQDDPERLLMEIDALVLDAYALPPKLEHELLVYFQKQGKKRKTGHGFGDYVPLGYESYFSLSTHLSPQFRRASAGAFFKHLDNR